MADKDSEALRAALRYPDLRAAFQQLAPFLNELPHQPGQHEDLAQEPTSRLMTLLESTMTVVGEIADGVLMSHVITCDGLKDSLVANRHERVTTTLHNIWTNADEQTFGKMWLKYTLPDVSQLLRSHLLKDSEWMDLRTESIVDEMFDAAERAPAAESKYDSTPRSRGFDRFYSFHPEAR